jgi:hypothetical protein
MREQNSVSEPERKDERAQTKEAQQDNDRARWWGYAFVPALAVVYGPFCIAASITWLFVSCDHCKLVWLKLLWVFPGLLLAYLARTLSQRIGINIVPPSETAGVIIGGILSVIIVFAVAWLAGKGRIAKWIVLPLTLALSAVGAFMAFHLVRA